MGHDDMRAALIYQRVTSDADQQIADRVSGLVTEYREGRTGGQDEDDDGPAGHPFRSANGPCVARPDH
ncbi:hypothetical protein ACWDKQ_11285 [Saccharopolyspora sp. NPDC000995]